MFDVGFPDMGAGTLRFHSSESGLLLIQIILNNKIIPAP
jgi:hypothetical protein